MTNFIAQVVPSVITISIAKFNSLPTASNGEQFALNPKKVDKLVEELHPDGVLLQQPLEVTVWNGKLFNTSGRHRGAALGELYEGDTMVYAIQYEVSTAEELAQRIVTANRSRGCTKSEEKLLMTAASHGFGTVDHASVMGVLFNRDGSPSGMALTTAKPKIVTLVAMALRLRVDKSLAINVSESLAKSLITQVAKMKRTITYETIIPPSLDKAGNEVGGGVTTTRSISKLLEEAMTSTAKMNALVDTIVAIANYTSTRGVLLSTEIVTKVQKGNVDGATCILEVGAITLDGAHVKFGFADNVTRGAAAWAFLMGSEVQREVSAMFELIDEDATNTTSDDEYGDID